MTIFMIFNDDYIDIRETIPVTFLLKHGPTWTYQTAMTLYLRLQTFMSQLLIHFVATRQSSSNEFC